MEKVREPLYTVHWQGKDVTTDISPYLIGLSYSDYLSGKSDEIELAFENRDRRWLSSWFPKKGDILDVKIGIADPDERWLKCGRFQIDEIEFSGPPDVVSVRGLSVFLSRPVRQPRNHSWENTSLSKILNDIARRNGLRPVIDMDSDIRFDRIDQKDQTDLDFLYDLCEKYGYAVKVDSERLIVARPENLEKRKAVRVISLSLEDFNVISFRFTTKTHEIYRACEVVYFDPEKKEEIRHVEVAEGVSSGSIFKIEERFENRVQAIERARAELKARNKLECEGDIMLLGDPHLVSGARIEITGFGKLDGGYLIEEASHRLSKGEGYVTSIKVRRI